jgi:regulator of nucleoside diphosphate kinase
MAQQPSLFITQQDFDKLSKLVENTRTDTADLLADELDRATILPQQEIPPNVVTMNSTVRFQDAATGAESEVTLVFPQDATAGRSRISVLAPVGAALIGLRVGDLISWPVPNGRVRQLKATAVLYQPEAAGDFNL